MAKKKRNANYVTDKTVKANVEAEAKAKKAKQDKRTKGVIKAVSIVLAIAVAVVLIGLVFGLFDYYPEATEHVTIEIAEYGKLHVELYGHDAPKTVTNFSALVAEGHFDGATIHTLLDGLLYAGGNTADGGSLGIKGEFSANGVENKVKHKRGVISMARGEGNDTAYDQFFIVTEDSTELDGNYAAFGMITDGMEIIDKIIGDSKTGDDGILAPAIKITSISSHDSHGH